MTVMHRQVLATNMADVIELWSPDTIGHSNFLVISFLHPVILELNTIKGHVDMVLGSQQ